MTLDAADLAAMRQFLDHVQHHCDLSGSAAEAWAAASAAAITGDPAQQQPHITAVRAWLSQATSDEDLTSRCLALTTLCGRLPGLLPGDIAQARRDPATFVAMAAAYYALGSRPQITSLRAGVWPRAGWPRAGWPRAGGGGKSRLVAQDQPAVPRQQT